MTLYAMMLCIGFCMCQYAYGEQIADLPTNASVTSTQTHKNPVNVATANKSLSVAKETASQHDDNAPKIHINSTSQSKSAIQARYWLAKANDMGLHKKTLWRRLLYLSEHNTPNTAHTKKSNDKKSNTSKVTQEKFFNAVGGRFHPKKELESTLWGMFHPVPAANMSVLCRFPARAHWLVSTLGITQLPKANCPAYDTWFKGINPHKTTLVFASDYLNNPSSMFGHTLLRIDQDNTDGRNQDLLAYAVTYAAQTNEGSGISFALKGLTGGYPGEFTILPYYKKVKSYGDLESRDLWEYELNLSKAQTAQLVRHIWEMRGIHFDYYFISDNCAYVLLALLDIADPRLNTKSLFPREVIPAQTVQRIFSKTNLIKRISFRPALTTQLTAQLKKHGSKKAALAHRLAMGDDSTLVNQPDKEQAVLLEMAYDDLYLHYLKRKTDKPQQKKRLLTLLTKRSQLSVPDQRPKISPPSSSPEKGHQTSRMTFGLQQGKNLALILGFKGAYHDLIARPEGYGHGMSINAVDLTLKATKEYLFVDNFTLIAIDSFSPITPFLTPKSWGVSGGVQQLDTASSPSLVGYFNYHVGIAKQIGELSLDNPNHKLPKNRVSVNQLANYCYAQMLFSTQAGTALDHGWRAALGPKVGCMQHLSHRLRFQLNAQAPFWFSKNIGKSISHDATHAQYEWSPVYRLDAQYDINPSQAVRLNIKHEANNALEKNSVQLTWLRYF